ncbi:hypothetical protein LZ30DRAFT_162979 [Colletotrichum cereale]|nr:hypothetical protein LZ30DRAFT_162979 [Colletotrichum cereale]
MACWGLSPSRRSFYTCFARRGRGRSQARPRPVPAGSIRDMGREKDAMGGCRVEREEGKKSNLTHPLTLDCTETPTPTPEAALHRNNKPVVSAVRCGAGHIIGLTSEIPPLHFLPRTNPTPMLSRVIGRPSRYGSLSTPFEASSSTADPTQRDAPNSQFPMDRSPGLIKAAGPPASRRRV